MWYVCCVAQYICFCLFSDILIGHIVGIPLIVDHMPFKFAEIHSDH